MGRSIVRLLALAVAAPVLLLPVSSGAGDRALPMRFDLRLEGPANICGEHCRLLVAASGAITADSPRDFANFAQGRNLSGGIVVLDSDGGSVHGAIALGQEIRKLGLDTTVGTVSDIAGPAKGLARAKLSPRADCESMCAFVLIAGVHRTVPEEARVMVHQIWLGDRRDDPTAATYSAEDLVLVQRDIGKLARYTAEMGASIDMLDLALRIPPWEPMHTMTREEITRDKVATEQIVAPSTGAVASMPPAQLPPPVPALTSGAQATTISERNWSVIDRSGSAALARRHPLTFEGEEIGSFDLILSCGASGDSYDISYSEHRHGLDRGPAPEPLSTVTVNVGYGSAALKVVSSEHRDSPDELVSYAAGTLPAALLNNFGGDGNHSLTVETKNAQLVTGIRIGNTGVRQALPQLAARCVKPLGSRAELPPTKAGGLAQK